MAAATTVGIPATQALGGDSGRAGNPSAVATVTRGPLTSQLHATGMLQYLAHPDGSPYTVIDHAGGTLTALPGVGQVIEQGQVLYRVADKPVVLLGGGTPAYRALSEGERGPDVRELNADLVALGYTSRSELDPSSDYFGASTAAALEKLQARLGLTQTGTLALGQAVFLPAPIRVTAVTATLGVRYAPAAPRAEF
ncbi:MAG TPA: peptidoglycan-binding domain-containing protein, partial [Solirubrobacteraceae bacterium]